MYDFDWLYHWNDRVLRDNFFVMRTRFAVNHSQNIFDALAKSLPEYPGQSVRIMGFGKNRFTWENCVVIRIRSKYAPFELVDRLEKPLSQLDGWMLHDCRGDFLETEPRLIGRFFDQCRPKKPVTQIYLLKGSTENSVGQTAQSVRDRLRKNCMPVFYMRGGQVLFVTGEPGRVIFRRIENELKSADHWAIIDDDGATFSSDNSDNDERVWWNIRLDELEYSDPDETLWRR